MGQPKQLLPYQGRSLLERSVEAATTSSCSFSVLVLGSNHKRHQKAISEYGIEVVINEDWEKGMSGSIKAGLTQLLHRDKSIAAVIIIPCDQPFVNAALVDQLIEVYLHSNKGIVACAYAETVGIPALFSAAYFGELGLLEGQAGAKQLINKNIQDCLTVAFPAGAIDIDTPEDYLRLNEK